MYKPDLSIDVEDDWEKENKRIMFLLKDQPSDWSDDARKWLKDYPDDKEETKKRKAKNRELRSKFIHNIAIYFMAYTTLVLVVLFLSTLLIRKMSKGPSSQNHLLLSNVKNKEVRGLFLIPNSIII